MSSRVLDALLAYDTVPHSAKRRVITKLMGHFHDLANDRIGSRVAERCWRFADLYTKARTSFTSSSDPVSNSWQERIIKSVIPHEALLLQSYYGKFFLRHLNLPLFHRSRADWKAFQIEMTLTSEVAKIE